MIMNAKRLFGALGALVVAMLMVGVQAATANPSSNGVAVVAVDATSSDLQLWLSGVSSGSDMSDLSVSDGGRQWDVVGAQSTASLATKTETIYVVDTEARVGAPENLGIVRDHLRSVAADLPSSHSVGLISAGTQATTISELSGAGGDFSRAVDRLSLSADTKVNDALYRSVGLFSDEPGVVRSVVLVTAGSDDGSSKSPRSVRSAFVQAGIQLYSVSIDNSFRFADHAASTGGLAVGVNPDNDLEQTLESVHSVAAQRWIVSVTDPGGDATRQSLTVSIGKDAVSISYPRGVFSETLPQIMALSEQELSVVESFVSTSYGLVAIIVLSFVGVSLGIWAAGSMLFRRDASLERRLASYGSLNGPDDRFGETETGTHSAFLQRAASMSESFAKNRGFLDRVEVAVERADLPLRAGEAMSILVAVSVLTGAATWVITRSPIAASVAVFTAALVLMAVVRYLIRRRAAAFQALLPDALNLLAGTLRAGFSLNHGLEAVSIEVADPMGHELRRAMAEARLGRELDECLEGVAERIGSEDFAWVVMAIAIQREVGGNLNELLTGVAETMIARERLHREIAVLTSEGKVSAAVLSFMPPGLALAMWAINPSYIGVLFEETAGRVMLGAGIVSALVGLAWMKKVVSVDV